MNVATLAAVASIAENEMTPRGRANSNPIIASVVSAAASAASASGNTPTSDSHLHSHSDESVGEEEYEESGDANEPRRLRAPHGPELVGLSKLPYQMIQVPLPWQHAVSRNEAKLLSVEQKNLMVQRPVRVMLCSHPPCGPDPATGRLRLTPSNVWFVAKDIAQLLHIHEANVARRISSFLPHERARMPVQCMQSNGTKATLMLSVLSVHGMTRLLTASKKAVMGTRLHTFLSTYISQLCQSMPHNSTVLHNVTPHPSPSSTTLSLHPSALEGASPNGPLAQQILIHQQSPNALLPLPVPAGSVAAAAAAASASIAANNYHHMHPLPIPSLPPTVSVKIHASSSPTVASIAQKPVTPMTPPMSSNEYISMKREPDESIHQSATKKQFLPSHLAAAPQQQLQYMQAQQQHQMQQQQQYQMQQQYHQQMQQQQQQQQQPFMMQGSPAGFYHPQQQQQPQQPQMPQQMPQQMQPMQPSNWAPFGSIPTSPFASPQPTTPMQYGSSMVYQSSSIINQYAMPMYPTSPMQPQLQPQQQQQPQPQQSLQHPQMQPQQQQMQPQPQPQQQLGSPLNSQLPPMMPMHTSPSQMPMSAPPPPHQPRCMHAFIPSCPGCLSYAQYDNMNFNQQQQMLQPSRPMPITPNPQYYQPPPPASQASSQSTLSIPITPINSASSVTFPLVHPSPSSSASTSSSTSISDSPVTPTNALPPQHKPTSGIAQPVPHHLSAVQRNSSAFGVYSPHCSPASSATPPAPSALHASQSAASITHKSPPLTPTSNSRNSSGMSYVATPPLDVTVAGKSHPQHVPIGTVAKLETGHATPQTEAQQQHSATLRAESVSAPLADADAADAKTAALKEESELQVATC